MARYIRVTHQITQRQEAFLASESERLGCSIPDLLRRILDEYMDRHAPREPWSRDAPIEEQDAAPVGDCKTCHYKGRECDDPPCSRYRAFDCWEPTP